MFWLSLYCYGSHVCYQQILFLLKNRSVEKILELCCCCCAAVYWKSLQDGSYSAGVCNLSPNENQMLMNQDIVVGWSSEALALTSTTQTFTHTAHTRTVPPPSLQPSLLPFPSLFDFICSSSPLRSLTHSLFSSPCQVPVQVSQFPKQTQRPYARGHLLARSACQDRCCLWKPSGGKNCLFRRSVWNTNKLVVWKN